MKLNLGCGDQILDEFVNVDRKELPGIYEEYIKGMQESRFAVYTVDDIIYLNKFEDNIAEMIYASHCLSSIFPRGSVSEALKNWHRVLKLSGQIIIEVSNPMPMILQYVKGEIPIELFIQGTYGHDSEGMRLFTCFNFEYLKKLLEGAGFKNVKEIEQPEYSSHFAGTNLCVEAKK